MAMRRAFYRNPRVDPEKSRRSHPEGPYPQDRRPGFARNRVDPRRNTVRES